MSSSNFKYNVCKTVRPYVKFIPQLTKPVLRVLIQVAVTYIETKKCSPEVLDLALNKLNHSEHEIPENFCELFAAILQIMTAFLRTPKGTVKDFELRECLKDLRFTDECADDLSKVLYNHRATLSKNYVDTKMERSKATNLQWRINISFAAEANQNITPTIILHFKLSDDVYRTLELPVHMFHKLRYNIALLLSELQSLENRAVMKKF